VQGNCGLDILVSSFARQMGFRTVASGRELTRKKLAQDLGAHLHRYCCRGLGSGAAASGRSQGDSRERPRAVARWGHLCPALQPAAS